ncbi:MAG: hypothetical protein M5Z89_10425 [Olivibacter sp.]|nr:hypothetical protein [Olivibacter sp. UJ_SKK_5.1]
MDLTTLNQIKEVSDKMNETVKAELKRLLGDRIGEVYTVFEYHTKDGLMMKGYPLDEGIKELKKYGGIREIDDLDF